MPIELSTRRRTSAKHAFTLLELMIILAIVAILAAMLLAAVSSARTSGRTTACANNLRQLALALQMYVNDSRDYPAFYTYPWRNGGKLWYDDIQPYTHQSWTNTLYLCPSYSGPATTAGVVSDQGFSQPIGSYGYNIGGVGAQWSALDLGLGGTVDMAHPQITAAREPRVRVPDDMIALGDAYAEATSGQVWPDHGVIGINFKGINHAISVDQANKRHGGKLNIAFCDAHTLAPKVGQLFDHSDDALRRWNNDHEPHRELMPP